MVVAMEIQKGFKQTEVGTIPSDWDVISLENLSIRIGDGIHTTPKYTDSANYFFINGNNLKDGKIVITDDTKRVSKDEYLKHKRELNTATVFISINGTIGNIAFYNNEDIVLGKSAAYINLNDKIDKKLIYQIIKTEFIKNYFENELTGSTIKNLGLGSIRNTPIPLPPTKIEQTAIATVLNDADALITQLEKLIAKKRAIKQGAMQELLKPKEGWEVKNLGGICQILKGRGLSKSHLNEYGKHYCLLYGELFTTYNEVINQIVSRTSSEEGLPSKFGDILFPGSTTTTGIDLAKASAILIDNVKLGSDLIVLRKRDYEYNSEFVTYFLNVIKRFEIAQNAKGVTIYHLHGKDLSDIEVHFPDIKIQTHIAQILSDMDAEIEALEKKLDKHKMLKQGMMQNLLTGRIRLV